MAIVFGAVTRHLCFSVFVIVLASRGFAHGKYS